MFVRLRMTKFIVVAAACLSVSACALLPSFGPKEKAREQVYTLEPVLAESLGDAPSCGSIALGDAIAAPGFRSSRMAYSAAPYEIDYFAYARWADSIARLLKQPLQRGLMAHSSFTEVLAAPTIAPTQFRIELGDVSLIQRFADRQSAQSQVELNVSVRVFSVNPNRVLATKEILLTEEAAGDPASGVQAANSLVATLVSEVTTFASNTCVKAL